MPLDITALSLVQPFTVDDVKRALFSIPSHKSPEPDGFNSGFFKSCWSIIGEDICQAVLGFFRMCKLLRKWNGMRISLIPKSDNPTSAANYRPIACCNTLHKCIYKMLCDRLRLVLLYLVHGNQWAFIEGRLIGHNIMICQDLVRLYQIKKVTLRCLIKIDLKKAYDSISWGFIDQLMMKMKFLDPFRRWIITMISSSTFTLNMSGDNHGFFQGGKGIR